MASTRKGRTLPTTAASKRLSEYVSSHSFFEKKYNSRFIGKIPKINIGTGDGKGVLRIKQMKCIIQEMRYKT